LGIALTSDASHFRCSGAHARAADPSGSAVTVAAVLLGALGPMTFLLVRDALDSRDVRPGLS